MSAWFIGFIGLLWLVPCIAAIGRLDWGNALMYGGFVVAQSGMMINAIRV